MDGTVDNIGWQPLTRPRLEDTAGCGRRRDPPWLRENRPNRRDSVLADHKGMWRDGISTGVIDRWSM